ncbi:MAG: LysR family transcriptional regulator [Pseudomonadota bacterium]|nr:LysR family transcriptional regulator [Pseudomonadota bacterium]
MDKRLTDLDWTLLRVFVAVAESGSLSAAARRLGSSQPTIGRHIHTLEGDLGMELFHRHAKGLTLTRSGLRLLPHARDMSQAAARLSLAAAEEDEGLSGTVRITASVALSHLVLPQVAAKLRQEAPRLQLDIVPSDSTENLLFREADIAIRMYRPEQLDMTTHHLGDIAMGAFATRAYLDRMGRPETLANLLAHDLIGYDKSDLIIRGMEMSGIPVTRDSFALRTDNQSVYWEMVRAGCGIGFGQVAQATKDTALERVLPALPVPGLPVWLTAPTALRHTPRLTKVWDALEQALIAYIQQTP